MPALYVATFCSAGSTKDAGCSDCATAAADSDCNYCKTGYYKTGAKACTVCPDGTGRSMPTATTDIETTAVCTIKSAPQLKCGVASSRYSCSTCPAGSYQESGIQFGEVSVTGCSTDCKTFTGTGISMRLVPSTDTPAPTSCISCGGSCVKCAFAPTLKACTGPNANCAVGINKQLVACSECANGYYLLPNKDEPTTVPPSCEACGANCKKCKDSTECTSCWPGWALDGTDKANCLKSVPVSSASIFKIALLSILALFIAW